MFIKLTLCENDQEIFVNMESVRYFHRAAGYTSIVAVHHTYEVMETPTEILEALAGIPK